MGEAALLVNANAVIRTMAKNCLRIFISSLAADYCKRRWSGSSNPGKLQILIKIGCKIQREGRSHIREFPFFRAGERARIILFFTSSVSLRFGQHSQECCLFSRVEKDRDFP